MLSANHKATPLQVLLKMDRYGGFFQFSHKSSIPSLYKEMRNL